MAQIVQRPRQTFREWFYERHPDCRHRDHVSMTEYWFTGEINDEPMDAIERLGNALSEYLDEQLTKTVDET